MSEVRPEAGVVPWKELTDEQQEAGRRAHALLVAMARSEEKVDQPTRPFLPRLDKARGSRVLLIDGGRGSGKTALLLSILACWRWQFLDEPPSGQEDPTAPDGLPDEKDPPAPKQSLREAVSAVRRRVVPIGLLDLHPIAPSTNLLFHVVGRFGRVVEWLDDSKVEQPPAWQLASETEIESRKTWRALLRAVAVAWDGHAHERRGRMDLDACVLDLEETERQRLDLVSAFTAFVEALVGDFCKHQRLEPKKQPPLFLLAIDDADMNPARAVELLDVLRMLWHPRVAFLLTGHSELFEQTLREHYLALLRKPLQGHHFEVGELGGVVEQRDHLQLAREAYAKTIPPGQRCEVREIPAGRRFTQKLRVGVAP